MSAAMIELSDVRFRWHRDAPLVLDIPAFEVRAGERVFLEGPSGSGKTTLLNILGGVTVPETGHVTVNDVRLGDLSGAGRDRFRADHIGFVFQMFNLIPYLSPMDNVILPCRFSQRRKAAAQQRSESVKNEARRLLRHMNLDAHKVAARPASAFSTGQQQRIAVARALIGAPPLVIADEPTSALDHAVRATFMDLMFEEVTTTDAALLFVSHDSRLATRFDRQVTLADINGATA